MAPARGTFRDVIRSRDVESALPVDTYLAELDAFIDEHNPYRINKVILPPNRTEDNRLITQMAKQCSACGYLHLVDSDLPAPDLCEHCGERLGAPARATPSRSSRCSFVLATTTAGSASKLRSAANAARVSLADATGGSP